MGTLYVVGVPLGNLGDITFRAVEILKSVDCILCEDTRNTKILLDKYGISSKILDCHKFNEKERSSKVSKILENDGKAALVSDAGTPNICDPGSVLEKELLNMGHKIVPIPGACALTTFLSAVPRDDEFFSFVGFLPKTSQKRIDLFKKYEFETFVFYDSPNRLKNTLEDIKSVFGAHKKIAIGRELTKIFEEIKISSVSEMIDYYENNTLKGEIVGLVFKNEEKDISDIKIKRDIETIKSLGFSDKDTSKIISALNDVSKNKIYDILMEDKLK